MLKTLFAAAVLMVSATVAQAEITPKEAAAILTASVVELNGKSCTASKVGPHQYMTAKHCVGRKMKLEAKVETMWAKSVVMAWQEKKNGNRQEDWAIINTATDTEDVKALTLGCNEEVYLGMRVAYAGYPSPTQFAFGMGNITSLLPVNGGSNSLDYVMDVHAAPGASGSPVISMDTGHVVGILTEGVMNRRIGAFMVGFESISNIDLCDFAETELSRHGVSATVPGRPELTTPF